MALGFTGAVRLGEEEANNRALFIGILGCNLAWAKICGALAAIVCFGMCSGVSAQTIRPVDYFPLALGSQWQFERVTGSAPSNLHLEVTQVTMADTGTRYFIDVPLADLDLGLRVEYAT